MPYFDSNATTPLHPQVREVWLDAADRWWYNASSLYREGAMARQRLDEAREELADLLGLTSPEKIIFTSGATEANSRLMEAYEGQVVWIGEGEHPSVRLAARRWCRVHHIPTVWDDGMSGGDSPPRLISLMAANNETGEEYALEPVAAWATAHGVAMHSDVSQWLGKRLPTALMSRISLTGCGHKFGGPKGVGFIHLAADTRWHGQCGGPQEEGLRAGTEDLPSIVAMVEALKLRHQAMSTRPFDSEGRDVFEQNLAETLPQVRFVAQERPRLWNTSMVIVPAHDNRLWLARLSQRGFQVSTGSACSSGGKDGSHVLEALGFDDDERKRSLRFSSDPSTTEGAWRDLALAMGEVAEELARRPGARA